ncbi:protein of unknown function [uncultured Woeseiaceae bacterium]|uniref:Uncharacterized protein n=1 Tax=uncultured Woeseiaceae bacterium TaxID=1983305 RepID=A0A7D9H496_9GAMM|nr:protein of unknown function [uncultured Woeseiaceae bacterium]
MEQATCVGADHPQTMISEIYISALLVDEALSDQVWKAWDKRKMSDFWAGWLWWTIVEPCSIDL